ncbi:MAG: pyrimidine reductase family protein [Mycobacteriales bacterium]
MRVLLPEPGPLPAGGLEEFYDPGADACVRGGFVLAVDGGVAVQGRAAGLHTASDKAVFRALRAVADVVLVGAGTVRTEDYGPVQVAPAAASWRRAHDRAPDVRLAIVSRSLALDPAARCFADSRPLVLTCAQAPPHARRTLQPVADLVDCGSDEVDLVAAVQALRARGLRQVLCEGGPTLLTELHRAGQLDELCLTVSPMVLGAAPVLLTRPLTEPARLSLLSVVDGGDGALLCRWRLEPPTG